MQYDKVDKMTGETKINIHRRDDVKLFQYVTVHLKFRLHYTYSSIKEHTINSE